MKARQTLFWAGSILALILGLRGTTAAGSTASQAGSAKPAVIRCPEGTGTLARRWEWARQVAGREKLASGYWVGYSIEKLMEENAFIGGFLGNGSGEFSLAALLRGETSLSPSRIRNVSHFFGGRGFRNGENDRTVKWVKKRVGVLYRFGKSGEALPETVGAVDERWPVAFEGKTLIWLGSATEDESLGILAGLYDKPAVGKPAVRIVAAAGIHEASPSVLDFLERVAKSRAAEAVRTEAVSCLGGYRDERTLRALLPLAKTDSSLSVRKEALSALGDLGLPEAINALIEVARSNGPADVREEAMQALAENPSEKVIAVLDRIIASDPVPDIQEEAVQALSEIEDGTGLPLLIKVARTHAAVEIRKSAIEALGESSDPRALAALIELAKKRGTGF